MNPQLINGLVDIAKLALPLLPFGGPAIIIAQAATEAMRVATETMVLSDDEIRALDDSRIELERAVNEHAKNIAARLQG